MSHAHSVVVALSCLLTACVRELPPAATPDAVVPAVDLSRPPADGHGRLIIDVVDGPTPVEQVTMQAVSLDDAKDDAGYRITDRVDHLCTTPCVADLPVGSVQLGFPILGNRGGVEREIVYVSAEPTVYRRSLTYNERAGGAPLILGILAAFFGGSSAVTGVTLLPIGLATDNDGLATAGGITLGAGALLVALGIWGIVESPSTYRPGSSLHFSLDAASN